MAKSFADRLSNAVNDKGNAVCVGLDPRADSLPEAPTSMHASTIADAFQQFCFHIIDIVAPHVPVVKPQAAFFEALGPAGCVALAEVNHYAQQSGLLVILDAKRGDIGSTAEAYAAAYCSGEESPWNCDAVTVNPFLGDDTLQPFVAECEKQGTGIFVLVKTSNPGSAFVQQCVRDGVDVSSQLARWISTSNAAFGSTYGSIGAVVGATYPDELAKLREQMPNAWLLIPGYGAQGGAADDLRQAWDLNGHGAVVNSSRGIIFAYRNKGFSGSDWKAAVKDATLSMIDDLNRVRVGK